MRTDEKKLAAAAFIFLNVQYLKTCSLKSLLKNLFDGEKRHLLIEDSSELYDQARSVTSLAALFST